MQIIITNASILLFFENLSSNETFQLAQVNVTDFSVAFP